MVQLSYTDDECRAEDAAKINTQLIPLDDQISSETKQRQTQNYREFLNYLLKAKNNNECDAADEC